MNKIPVENLKQKNEKQINEIERRKKSLIKKMKKKLIKERKQVEKLK